MVLVGEIEPGYMGAEIERFQSGQFFLLHVVPRVPSAELRSYYSLATVTVFPWRSTLSCLDAQACGSPVIMQEDKTNGQRLEKGGLLFQEGSADSLAQRIIDIIDNESLRSRLSSEGRQHVVENYDYASIVRRLESDLENTWTGFARKNPRDKASIPHEANKSENTYNP